MKPPHQIKTDFIVMSPDKKATVERADAALYARLDETYNQFKDHELVAYHEFESDWRSWEVHPHGDEIVLLISGEIEFLLDEGTKQTRITLKEQGEYLIVPQGVWHTAKTKVLSQLLFITPGQGTQHKENSSDNS